MLVLHCVYRILFFAYYHVSKVGIPLFVSPKLGPPKQELVGLPTIAAAWNQWNDLLRYAEIDGGSATYQS